MEKFYKLAINKNSHCQKDFPKEAIEIYSELSLKEKIDSQVFSLITSSLNNSLSYLQYLNSKRSNLITISPLIFEQMSFIFLGILTNIQGLLFIEQDEKDIKEKCYRLLDYIIVLSQTFYLQTNEEEEEKGELLLTKVKQHSIWNDTKLWKFLIQFTFKNNFEKQKELIAQDAKKKDKKTIQKILIEKEKSLMKNTLITFKYHLINFELQSLNNSILDNFIEKYNLYDVNDIDF